MIVCSCNVLTDGEIKSCLDGSPGQPRTSGEVYAALGCTPRCGRCAPTIKSMLREAGACCKNGVCTAELADCAEMSQMEVAEA